ncbi:endospore germination permease [Paenibacillus sp. FSL R5-0527]|uniref:GerAB/ArcD/ProY family transporter n=1 Tax=Paenibacillus sp. FSL R5-0527 TaxID=2975321 RepID=UPI000979F502|nr:hypothetical protein BK140_30890 [Paenibacillus macerans]
MRISNRQLFWLVWTFEMGINLLISLNFSITDAKQDVWISLIIAWLAAMLIAYLAFKVSRLYPGQTLLEFSISILGKWPGKLVGLLYLLQWYWVMGIILREQFSFIRLSMLQKTPDLVIAVSFLAIAVYAVRKGGIVGLGRFSELWGPVLLFVLLLTFALSMRNLNLGALLPVYADTEALAILKGSLTPMSLLGEIAFITMLVAFLEKPDRSALRNVWLGVTVASLILAIGAVWVIMTFGPALSSKIQFPFFEMVKLVYLMEFIQNMDIFLVAIWLISVFIKLTVYLFIASYGTAQWIGRPAGWKNCIWFVAAVTLAVCMAVVRLNPSSRMLLTEVWINYVLPLHFFAIPLLLLLVGTFRKNRKKGES